MPRPRWRRWIVPALTALILIGATLATMSWREPPRFDGAGYALLGRSLAEGRGYREIGLPTAPRHAHFPPAYPAVLALVWRVVGTTEPARFTVLAHALSLATLAVGGWAFARWYRLVEPRGVALGLSLALASNWTWHRTGGVIRSEPLAIALGGLTLLAVQSWGKRPGSSGRLLGLSALVGLGILTRQVAACWALALAIEVVIRRGWRASGAFLGGVAVAVAPWVAWQVRVGSQSQVSLFRSAGWPDLVAAQALFYTRRIPDAIAGPFVEVATVFARVPWLGTVATGFAVVVTLVVVLGWVRMLQSPRRRLGGLIPLVTLPLLLVWPFTEAGRFLIPLVPFVLLGAVEGGSLVLGWVGWRRSRAWAVGLVLAATLPYPSYALITHRAAAERTTQRDFDAACGWIAAQAQPEGPVMARHPGDVAWLTGRLAVAIPDGDPSQLVATIRRDRVALLLIDDDRYARSPSNPLAAVVGNPDLARLVWGGGSTAVYAVTSTAP